MEESVTQIFHRDDAKSATREILSYVALPGLSDVEAVAPPD